MRAFLQGFSEFYQDLSLNKLALLERFYANDIRFIDPAHQIQGLEDLQQYFRTLLINSQTCRILFEETIVEGDCAFVSWEMQLIHPRLNRGQLVCVPGVSKLRVDPSSQRILYQRDYFDLGAMCYEQLPLLGALIRRIKRGLGQ